MSANENQIVVYQPNETVRLDVRLENETVWLSQSQMATLFGCSSDNIGLHLKNVYAAGELVRESTTEDFSVVRMEVMSSLRRQDGRRNHPWSSRLNSQGDIGTPRIRQGQVAQGEEGCCEMKCLGVNCFRCRALRYDGQVGFTKLDSAEICRIKKRSFTTGTR